MKHTTILFLILTSITLNAQNTYQLSGHITSVYDDPIGDVTIIATNTQDNTSITTTASCDDGTYLLEDLEEGIEYELALLKEGSAYNGISTFDLVLISKHILDVEPLDSYRFYGADINASGQITVQDLVMLRLVVVNIWDDFPGNNWHFFAEGTDVPAETFNVMLTSDVNDFNFIAVKKGDVNSSAQGCE